MFDKGSKIPKEHAPKCPAEVSIYSQWPTWIFFLFLDFVFSKYDHLTFKHSEPFKNKKTNNKKNMHTAFSREKCKSTFTLELLVCFLIKKCLVHHQYFLFIWFLLVIIQGEGSTLLWYKTASSATEAQHSPTVLWSHFSFAEEFPWAGRNYRSKANIRGSARMPL